ncbi:hypothetical protein [Nocardioides immobilis]|uniref:hypothetical protein n=1 Tax=Nocardioides immobilis TaxID=2049295 RepID=UPI0015FAED1F|nr:hypothetical protein [Nocardioides immobilis]
MSMARGLGMGAGAFVLVVALGQPAVAAGWWCSKDDPLNVYEDGVVQGQAYGHYYDYGDGRAMSTAWYRDARPGDGTGNPVRVETDFYWYGSNSSCGEAGTCFWFDVSKQTDETHSSSWQKHARARYLDQTAWRSRGRMDICEVQRFSNDPCSAKIVETFDY